MSWAGRTTFDEVRAVWGGRLRPVAGELIPPAASPRTRQFLTEVGLPTTDVLHLAFVPDERLIHRDGRDFLPLTAEDHTNHVLAVELSTDRVYDVSLPRPEYTRFLNSDITALIFFLGLLHRALDSGAAAKAEAAADAKDFDTALDHIRAELTARDPAAMEGETPWELLLEDLQRVE